jgi:hypothetical protein
MLKYAIVASCATSLVVSPLSAQTAAEVQPAAEAPRPIEALAPVAQPKAELPANTEVILGMNDDLTTKGGAAEEGTMFGLTVVHDVKLAGYTVIPKGARGVGEVTWKTGKGAFGKSGKMEIELRYVEVGGQRIPVEGKYRQEGEGNTVATVGTVVLAGVFAGFVTGKSAKIPRGRELSARTKEAIPVNLPVVATTAPVGLQAVADQPTPVQAPAVMQAATPPSPSE